MRRSNVSILTETLGLTNERCATLRLQSRRSNSERRRNCLVNLVINRFDAISAGDIGREIGKTGSSRIGGNRGHVERAKQILDVGKGLSDTVGVSAADPSRELEHNLFETKGRHTP